MRIETIYAMDTDHISFLQGATPEGIVLRRRLRAVSADDHGTTVVTYEEQCRGWLDKIHRAATPEARILAYADLKDNLTFFSRIAVWEYSAAVEAEYAKLVKAKVRIGTKDLLIASIALANNAVVLTRNIKDFGKIPGLKIENWTV